MNPEMAQAKTVRPLTPRAHEVGWTPENIERFWNYHSSRSGHEDTYFSKVRGRAIIEFVSSKIAIGTALDMGCGRGDLIGHLLDRYPACGADQSPESVDIVTKRFSGNKRFRGATVGTHSLPDKAIDTVFLIEVVEHLNDATLASVLSEARRLLKPQGHLVLTTPNNEDLESSKTICPECACIFHYWQHVRSWSRQSLEEKVQSYGFAGTATSTLLSPYSGLKRFLQKTAHRLRGERMPHLVYIGRAAPS